MVGAAALKIECLHQRNGRSSRQKFNPGATVFLPIALAIASLPLGGCGGDSSPSSSTASQSSSTGAPPAPAPTTPAATPTTPAPAPVNPTAIPGVEKKSIRSWVSCDGTSDDATGVAKAFAAASHAAFTLVVDCPVRIHTGLDISRTIFIDDDTTVEFTETGKFTVDNTLFPAFVIANSSNITLTGWNVEYDASVPVKRIVDGYSQTYHLAPGMQPAGAFNDYSITQWLAKNRGITFDARQGFVTSLWSGNTNVCAVFFISGDSSQVTVTGMQIGVPAAAGGDRFIPVVFSLNPNYKSNQTITAKTPITAQFVAVPHDLTFSNVSVDGTYMGWVGNTHDTVLENIQSRRYGDLQDSQGNHVGGIEKWFMPPHLIYFSHADSMDPALLNKNIQITNVVDEGVRIGRARDAAGEVRSGNALSL